MKYHYSAVLQVVLAQPLLCIANGEIADLILIANPDIKKWEPAEKIIQMYPELADVKLPESLEGEVDTYRWMTGLVEGGKVRRWYEIPGKLRLPNFPKGFDYVETIRARRRLSRRRAARSGIRVRGGLRWTGTPQWWSGGALKHGELLLDQAAKLALVLEQSAKISGNMAASFTTLLQASSVESIEG